MGLECLHQVYETLHGAIGTEVSKGKKVGGQVGLELGSPVATSLHQGTPRIPRILDLNLVSKLFLKYVFQDGKRDHFCLAVCQLDL